MLTSKDGNKASPVNGMVCGNCGSENINTVEPYVMDVKQAAIFLGRSEYMIRELCRKRELPHSRSGKKGQGKIYFTSKALIQWLEKKERSSWR